MKDWEEKREEEVVAHTQTHIYIYIYIYRERGNAMKINPVNKRRKKTKYKNSCQKWKNIFQADKKIILLIHLYRNELGNIFGI